MLKRGNKDFKLGFKKDARIFVLMGGVSSEREISFKSGKAVFDALKKFYENTFCLDVNTDNKTKLKKILKDASIDVAFIALHGKFGEDGKIQGILEELSIPYTGSRIEASNLAMDKHKSKVVFRKSNIPSCDFTVLYKDSSKNILKKLNNFPYIVKPANGGSSIGLMIIRQKNDFNKALNLAFQYDSKIIIEKYIEGREFTVAILEDEPLDIIEILPRSRFFDFKAKYKNHSTEYIIPAKIPHNITNIVKGLALASHSALGCNNFSRVDIMLDKYYNPFILEVNTIPGLTNKSLLPKAALKKGVDFDQLCIKLLNSALQWQSAKKTLINY